MPDDAASPPTAKPELIRKHRYKKHFLKQVIVRIDFGTPLPIAKNGPPKRVVERLKTSFPRAELERLHERSFALLGSPTLVDSKEKPQWVYSSRDRQKKVHLTEDFCSIEYVEGSYDSFEVLEGDFLSVVSAMFEAFENLQINRLGLRYVNQIELPEDDPTDWSKYLTPNLLSLFELADDRTTLSRVFHLLEFNYGDMSLRFQSGMVNPDYPAAIKRKRFILDYDCYCQLLLSENEIARFLREFHNKINSSFEEVITDRLRKVMDVQNGG